MKKISFSLVVFALSTILAPVMFGAPETSPSSPVAVVNGQVITSDFLNIMADLKRILTSIYTIDEKFFNVLTGTPEGIEFLQRYRLEVLNELIDQLLTQQIAKEEGVYPSEDEVKRHVEDQIEKALSKIGVKREDFEKYLATFGMTLDDLREKFAWVYTTNACLDALKEKATRNVKIYESEIEDYYEENYLSQKGKIEKEIFVIVTESKDDAKSAMNSILSGKSFEDVASEMSIDRETAKQGGKVDILDKEKIFYLFGDEVGQKVWKASEGAILGPYKVGVKWVLIKIGKVTEKKIPGLSEVKDDIEKILLEKKKEEVWKKWWEARFNTYKKRSKIEILIGGGKK